MFLLPAFPGCSGKEAVEQCVDWLIAVQVTCIIMLGGSRYVPGSAAACGESGDVRKADPFTGSTRYVPTDASTSAAGCHQ